jgi:hypothetical protein
VSLRVENLADREITDPLAVDASLARGRGRSVMLRVSSEP